MIVLILEADGAKKYLIGNSCDFVRTNAVIRPPPPQNSCIDLNVEEVNTCSKGRLLAIHFAIFVAI